VRSRTLFVERGVAVAVIDAPSDKLPQGSAGSGRRPSTRPTCARSSQWLKDETKLPVWLVGTSRGTQSAAATALAGVGADGVVLTSTVLYDPRGRPVNAMPLERLAMPALVVHHKGDVCAGSPYSLAPALRQAERRVAQGVRRGRGRQGRRRRVRGVRASRLQRIEPQVVDAIVAFMLAK
jgi:hypothetical protein